MHSSPSSLPASPLGSQQHSGARSCVDFQSVLCGSLPALLFYNLGKEQVTEKLLLCISLISVEDMMEVFLKLAEFFQRAWLLENISCTRINILRLHLSKRRYLVLLDWMWLSVYILNNALHTNCFHNLLVFSLAFGLWRSLVKALTWRYRY